jgi:hypothetical protein
VTGHESDKEIVNAPVVQETVRRHEVDEVTPMIERDVDRTEIQQVIERDEEYDEQVHTHERTLPTEVRDTVIHEGEADVQRQIADEERKVEDLGGETHVLEPIVKENVRVHVVEEIQPIIERTVDETHIVHTTQPIKEHHVLPPVLRDEIVERPRATRRHG